MKQICFCNSSDSTIKDFIKCYFLVFPEKDGRATKYAPNYVGAHQFVNDGMVISAAQYK